MPDKEFRDKALEKAKQDAYSKASIVTRVIAFRTRPLAGGLQTVKLANHGPQPDSVREDARVINAATTEFAESHEAFVRLGRMRLTLT